MHRQKINISRCLWRHLKSELRCRGGGRHEAGCFLLGKSDGNVRTACNCVFYDQLDPNAYASGVCILDGNSFGQLWETCRREGMTVIADVHTHPRGAYQSESDRTNPMVARAGHIAIILPNFASGWIWRHRLGLFQYRGDHRWTDLSGWKARRYIKIGWSLI